MKKVSSAGSLHVETRTTNNNNTNDTNTPSSRSYRRSSSIGDNVINHQHQRQQQLLLRNTKNKKLKKKKIKKKHPQHLMESFRDLLEEIPKSANAARHRHSNNVDTIGEAMTELLNDPNSYFQYQRPSSSLQKRESSSTAAGIENTTNEPNNDDDISATKEGFQPLISVQNWKRFKALMCYLKHLIVTSRPTQDIPNLIKQIHHYVFWNVKSSSSSITINILVLRCLYWIVDTLFNDLCYRSSID